MFVVFSLPRSRSAWLSVFLGARVGHDIGLDCDSPEQFVERVGDLGGSCETGAAFAWPLIRQMLPRARFAVILRDPEVVAQSLHRFGLTGYLPEMKRRHAALLEISRAQGVLTVDFEALNHAHVCGELFGHCTGAAMHPAWWEKLSALNVQVDMPARIEKMRMAADRVATLKAEVARRLCHV